MKRLFQRPQRTIARPVSVDGIGYITGKTVHLRFVPAPANAGVTFARVDLGKDAVIAARAENVTGTQRRTTIGHAPITVGLVEHVLAALAGLHIDNCRVELNAPEPPGMDGSALAFVDAIRSAGAVVQDQFRSAYTVEETTIVESGDATLAIHPADRPELRISYILDYGPRSPIVRQVFTEVVTPQTFVAQIAPSRTFLLEEEAHALMKQGIGKNSTLADLLVFGPRGPIDNVLRFGNEPARHKALDIIGDLSLCGHDLCGHIVAYRSGHPLNVELATRIRNRIAPALPKRAAA